MREGLQVDVATLARLCVHASSLRGTRASGARRAARVARRGWAVEASFGVAAYPDDGTTAVDLLRAADRALYAAKRTQQRALLAPPDAA
jgi:GGDEF domain-containing protein